MCRIKELPKSITDLLKLDDSSKEEIKQQQSYIAWDKLEAKNTNIKEEYLEFLKEFPESFYVDQAQEKYDILSNPFRKMLKIIKDWNENN